MDGFDAALRQLAEHGERLTLLDQREAEHFRAVGERLTELGSLITALAARVAGAVPGDGDGDSGEAGFYRPAPAPRWWKLQGPAREQARERLAGWVGEVYRPGYGQLAATLGPCWGEHPLCLYALDIACELWSVLYLQNKRTPGMLSAQAEYQTRILPALAGQMQAETRRCDHAQHRATANSAATGRRP